MNMKFYSKYKSLWNPIVYKYSGIKVRERQEEIFGQQVTNSDYFRLGAALLSFS